MATAKSKNPKSDNPNHLGGKSLSPVVSSSSPLDIQNQIVRPIAKITAITAMPIPKFLGDIPRIFVVELAVEVDEGAEELEEAVELVFSWAADPLAAGAAAPVAEVAAPLALKND